MCKKLLMLLMLFVALTFVSSASAANMYWIGYDTDWLTASNWGGTGACPTYNDWVDIRSDSWVANYPVITTGQTALAGTIRMNPGYGPQVASITVSGGTLNIYKELYIGDSGGPADFIINSGTVNIGVSGTNVYTAVGSNGGTGRLYINGGTFNAGTLGLPKWWGPASTGNAYIDGGHLNTNGIMMGGAGNAIEFTKNLADSGGLLTDVQDMNDTDFAAWQTTVAGWVSSGQIFSSAGEIQVDYSSVGETRTTAIYSVIPEPMTVALLGIGGLLLRRRRK